MPCGRCVWIPQFVPSLLLGATSWKSLSSSYHCEIHISASKLLNWLKHQDEVGFKCSPCWFYILGLVWQIWFKLEHGIFITCAPSSCMKLTCSWLQHPGVRTSQTRSHYGAETDFPCLPALERPKHHPVESFLIHLNIFSLSEELPSMRRVSWQGHDSAILDYNVTAKLHFHHSSWLSSLLDFFLYDLRENNHRVPVMLVFDNWCLERTEKSTFCISPSLLQFTSVSCVVPQFSWEVFGSCLGCAACFEIAFCSLEFILIFSFLVNIFMISFAPLVIEGLKNCCDPSLWILPRGTEAVAFLIMPQTSLILERTLNFEQNNNQNKNPNFTIAAFSF